MHWPLFSRIIGKKCQQCANFEKPVAAVLADRVSIDNQKMTNLTNNLSKMSNETYSEAINDPFKTLFRKRTNPLKFVYQLVQRRSIRGRTIFNRIWPCLAGHGHASTACGTWYESITTELLIYKPITLLFSIMIKTVS